MQRRQFLQGLGSAGAATLLAACAQSFQIPRNTMTGQGTGNGLDERDSDGMWREAAAYARWTPSPHNIQPWRLRVLSAHEAEVYHDPRRRLPDTDPTSAFTTMSLAMFVEALSIAVAPHRARVEARYEARTLDYTTGKPSLFATLRLIDEVNVPRSDALEQRERLLQRKTSRLPYDGTPVSTESLAALVHAGGLGDHRLQWSDSAPFIHDCLELNRRALFDDLQDNATRTELARWIRPTHTEAESTKDGLWAHCLRFPGWLLRDFFEHHERWARGKRADLCGRLLLRGLRGTRTIAWWSGPFATPADWIQCGQVLHRSWLELTRHDLQLHPFGSVVTNLKTHAAFLARLGDDAPRDPVWLIARIGRSARPPRSYRLETPALFLDDRELT